MSNTCIYAYQCYLLCFTNAHATCFSVSNSVVLLYFCVTAVSGHEDSEFLHYANSIAIHQLHLPSRQRNSLYHCITCPRHKLKTKIIETPLLTSVVYVKMWHTNEATSFNTDMNLHHLISCTTLTQRPKPHVSIMRPNSSTVASVKQEAIKVMTCLLSYPCRWKA
jgi:hypothetical protein